MFAVQRIVVVVVLGFDVPLPRGRIVHGSDVYVRLLTMVTNARALQLTVNDRQASICRSHVDRLHFKYRPWKRGQVYKLLLCVSYEGIHSGVGGTILRPPTCFMFRNQSAAAVHRFSRSPPFGRQSLAKNFSFGGPMMQSNISLSKEPAPGPSSTPR
jgi:hypothetical protein